MAKRNLPYADDVDGSYYYAMYPDVAAAGAPPARHYHRFGWHEGRNPDSYFDTLGYLTTYKDVAAAGIDPLAHFHRIGWREGREPSPAFDAQAYLAANPDVAAAGIDPLAHYLRFGRAEGRAVIAKPLYDADGTANAVNEHAGAGSATGVTFSWGGFISPNLHYTLVGDTSGGGFQVNASTGAVTIADPSKVDYDGSGASHSYTVTVQASDLGHTINQTATIAVRDVNDHAPVFTSGATGQEAENTAATNVVYTAHATDADGTSPNNTVSYSLTAGAGDNDQFSIDATTGAVTFKSSPDYEHSTDGNHDNVYNIVVTATDGGTPALSATRNVTITVTDVNDNAPIFKSAAATSSSEGTSTTTTVYTASATDADGTSPNNTVHYTLEGDDKGAFKIDPASGAVTFVTSPDYESPADSGADNVYDIVVRATDGGDPFQSSTQAVKITVTNVAPSAPADADGNANSVSEGDAAKTSTGLTASSSDINGGKITYSLSDSAGGRFVIDSGSGEVFVSDLGASTIDYETSGGRYKITVRASDGTLTTDKDFTIVVQDKAPGQAPGTWSDADNSDDKVVEGAATGSGTGITALATDPNGGGVSYAIVDGGSAPAGAFKIDANGVITVADGSLIDYETRSDHAYTINVKASDANRLSTTNLFTVNVTDAAPSQPTGGMGSVVEGAGAGTPTGLTVTAMDPGGGGMVTYSLSNDAGGLFKIDPTSGKVTVSALGATQIDYESSGSLHQYGITVSATDSSNASSSQNFTIAVTDAPPTEPMDADGTPNRVLTNAPGDTPVGVTLASTEPGGTHLQYGIVDGFGIFQVDPDSGVVSIASNHAPIAPNTTYTITGTVSDRTSVVDSKPIDIYAANPKLNLDLDGDDSSHVTGNDYKTTYTEHGAPVAIADADDVITNASGGNGMATGARIDLGAGEVNDYLTVNGPLPGGIQVARNGGNVLILSGAATYADYAAAIRSIYIYNTDFAPSTNERTIFTSVTDATGTSPYALTKVSVTAVNDKPTLKLTDANGGNNPISYIENGGTLAFFANGSVFDPDMPVNFDRGTYTVAITGNAANPEDLIVLRASSGFTTSGTSVIYNSQTIGTVETGTALGTSKVIIDLNANATPTVVNALTTAFGYRDSSDNPSTAERTVSFTFNDGGNTGTGGPLASKTITKTLDVSEVNDAPTTVDDIAATRAEDTGPWTITGTNLAGNDYTGPSGVNETGQTLTVVGATNAVGGTVQVVNGNVVFTPTQHFNGAASFDYTVRDNGTTAGAADPKTATGHVTFTVTEVNDTPTTTADTLSSVAEGSGPRTIAFTDLTGNDSPGPANESGQTLTVTNVSNAVGGTVAISNGAIVFTPNTDFTGTASFDYTVTDNGTTNGAPDPRSAVGHASFTVTEINDTPVPVDDTLTTVTEDSGPRTIAFTDLTGNDSPGPNESTQTLTVTAVSNAVGGTVAISNGAVVFTPTAQFNGPASFDYTVTDNGTTNGAPDPRSAVGHASFTVSEVNDPPTAVDDTLSAVAQNSGTRIIAFTTLTGNDSPGPTNESSQTLTITSVGNAVGGTVAINDNNVEFTPTLGFTGTASFDYTLQDNGTTAGLANPQTDNGHVSFEVATIALDLDEDNSTAPGNDYATRVITPLAAVAIADADTSLNGNLNNLTTATIEIVTGFVSGEDVLAFTSDGTTMGDIAGTFDPATGTLTLTSNNGASRAQYEAALKAVTYEDTAQMPTSTADRTITVVVGDGTNTSNTATATVSFDTNQPPMAVDDSLSSVAEDSGTRTIQFSDLTGNDSPGPANESGQTLTVTAVSNAVGGTVAINNGTVVFTPTANFNGAASFDYTVTDNGTSLGQSDPKSDVGHVTFVVTEVNDAPVPVADTLTSVAEDSGSRTIAFSDLTGNDSKGPPNESGQTLTVIAVSNAVGGTVQISNGAVVFTPASNFNGTASFDYTVRDNGTTNGTSDPKTAVGHASFTVTEVNDAPVPVADTLSSVAEDSGPRTIQFADLTGNDSPGPSDESGQALTVTAVSNAVGGTVTISNGTVVFTPGANFNGTASFDYTVQDNGTTNGAPDPRTAGGHASFNVTPVNAAPKLDLDSTDATASGTGYTTTAFAFGAAVPVAGPNISITDVDNTTLAGATVTLTVGNSTDQLVQRGALPTGISVAFSPGTGTLVATLSGTASLADYQNALQRIAFSTNDPSDSSTRTVTVTVDDGQTTDHLSNTATTTINVSGNQPPVAKNDTSADTGAVAATEAGGTSNMTAGVNGTGNVLMNDTDDRDTGKLVVSSVKYTSGGNTTTTGTVGQALTGAHGALTLRADGSYTYVVNENDAAVQALNTTQTLTDSFTYTARDTGGLDSNAATLTVTIKGANDAPVAVADQLSATEAGTMPGVNPSGMAPGFLANDTDVDSGDTKTVQGIAAATQSGPLTGNLGGTGVVGSHGTLTVQADGSYAYAVNQTDAAVQGLRTFNQTLPDTYSYTVKDAGGLTSTTQVTVTIHGQNDAPVAVADTASVTEAGGTNNGTAGVNPATGNVLTNDTDPDAQNGFSTPPASGETHVVSGVAFGVGSMPSSSGVGTSVVGTYGSLIVNANGTYTYTLDNTKPAVQALKASDHPTDTFTYSVQDAAGATSTTTLTITVNGANDAPTVNSFNAPTNEDTGRSITLQGNDPDGSVTSYKITALPSASAGALYSDAGYTTTISAGQTVGQTVYFKPAANYSGTGSFQYAATDNDGLTGNAATVTIDISPVADPTTFSVGILQPTVATGAVQTTMSGTGKNQQDAAVAAISGGYVVVDTSVRSNGNADINAQRYNSTGTAVGVLISVADNSAGVFFDSGPSVEKLSNGGFIIVWERSNDVSDHTHNIMGRIYDANGTPAAAAFTIVNGSVDQTSPESPSIAVLGDGTFVVTYELRPTDGSSFLTSNVDNVDVYASHLSSTGGVLSNVQVPTNTTQGQVRPDIATLSDGGYLVVWLTDVNPTASPNGFSNVDFDIHAQRYNSSGAAVHANGTPGAEEFVISTTVNGGTPSVAALAGGGWVVTWQAPDAGGLNNDIHARVFSPTGVGGSEIIVNTSTTGNQNSANVTALPDGGFVVSWTDDNTGITDIIGQRFDAAGVAIGTAFTINQVTTGDQSQRYDALAVLGNGDLVSAWHTGDEAGIPAHSIVFNLPADGVQNVLTPLTTLNASPSADPSEVLSYHLSMFPAGTTFSVNGTQIGSLVGSEWVISNASDITALKTSPLQATVPTPGKFTLTIDAQSTDTATLSGNNVVTDVSHNIKTIAVGIKPTADPVFAAHDSGPFDLHLSAVADTANVHIDALPDDGQITYADGTLVTAGANLSGHELAGLKFTPTDTAADHAANLIYTVSNGTSVDTQTLPIYVQHGSNLTLTGTAEKDVIVGGSGSDTLIGNGGGNFLTGGGGADTFVFDAKALSDASGPAKFVDHITDYSAAQHDTIDVTALIAKTAVPATQASDLVHVTANADGTSASLTVNTGGTGDAAHWVEIAHLDGVQAGDTVDVALDAAHPQQVSHIHVEGWAHA